MRALNILLSIRQ